MIDDDHPTCPSCGGGGRAVGPQTVLSLLTPEAAARACAAEGLRVCRRSGCDVVYFGGDQVFSRADLRVPVFRKSSDPLRLVCYCFRHRVADIEEDVRAVGDSDVPQRIMASCRAGFDRCELTNPEGRCCLGDVRELVVAARRRSAVGASPGATAPSRRAEAAESAAPDGCAPLGSPDAASAAPDRCGPLGSPEAACAAPAATPSRSATDRTADGATPAATPECCGPGARASGQAAAPAAPSSPTARGARASRAAAAGAVVAAVLSSACCWLPLAFLGLGASVAGVAAFFEAWRGWLLGGTGALLGVAFWFHVRGARRCEPGSACKVPDRRVRRINAVLLWSSAALVAAFAAFSAAIGALAGGGLAVDTAAGDARAFAIEGMTCEGCSGHVREALLGPPGVVAAEVSYTAGRATLVYGPGASADEAAVAAAVAELGYEARPEETGPAAPVGQGGRDSDAPPAPRGSVVPVGAPLRRNAAERRRPGGRRRGDLQPPASWPASSSTLAYAAARSRVTPRLWSSTSPSRSSVRSHCPVSSRR